MITLPLILVGLAVAIAAYVISIYNSLQTLKTRIQASIQEIGNQLKRQADLIPNLLESAKGYLKHEKEVFGMLTDARKSVDAAAKNTDMSSLNDAASKVQALLPKMQILVESNPELQADQTMLAFMSELRDTADKLMYARRVLIDLSQDYNAKLVVFPSNIVANMFGFKPEKGLETPMSGSHLSVSETETKPVNVKF